MLFLTSAKTVVVLALTLKDAYGFNFVKIWSLFSNSNLKNLLVTWAMSRKFLGPDDLQNKLLSRPLAVKKGYIQVVRTQTSDCIEGQWMGAEIKITSGDPGGRCVYDAEVLIFD